MMRTPRLFTLVFIVLFSFSSAAQNDPPYEHWIFSWLRANAPAVNGAVIGMMVGVGLTWFYVRNANGGRAPGGAVAAAVLGAVQQAGVVQPPQNHGAANVAPPPMESAAQGTVEVSLLKSIETDETFARFAAQQESAKTEQEQPINQGKIRELRALIGVFRTMKSIEGKVEYNHKIRKQCRNMSYDELVEARQGIPDFWEVITETEEEARAAAELNVATKPPALTPQQQWSQSTGTPLVARRKPAEKFPPPTAATQSLPDLIAKVRSSQRTEDKSKRAELLRLASEHAAAQCVADEDTMRMKVLECLMSMKLEELELAAADNKFWSLLIGGRDGAFFVGEMTTEMFDAMMNNFILPVPVFRTLEQLDEKTQQNKLTNEIKHAHKSAQRHLALLERRAKALAQGVKVEDDLSSEENATLRELYIRLFGPMLERIEALSGAISKARSHCPNEQLDSFLKKTKRAALIHEEFANSLELTDEDQPSEKRDLILFNDAKGGITQLREMTAKLQAGIKLKKPETKGDDGAN